GLGFRGYRLEPGGAPSVQPRMLRPRAKRPSPVSVPQWVAADYTARHCRWPIACPTPLWLERFALDVVLRVHLLSPARCCGSAGSSPSAAHSVGLDNSAL